MSWSIVHEEPVEFTCKGCNGRGYVGDGYECECGGTGTDWFDLSALATLAHNLAIGAQCERAYRLGWSFGYCCRLASDDENPCWSPGKAAP